jgi:uncharacterized protein
MPPSWPALPVSARPGRPHRGLAQVSLTPVVNRTSTFGRTLGHRRVRLDVLDYPGEWLQDLPLLGQMFQEWSAQTMTLLR